MNIEAQKPLPRPVFWSPAEHQEKYFYRVWIITKELINYQQRIDPSLNYWRSLERVNH